MPDLPTRPSVAELPTATFGIEIEYTGGGDYHSWFPGYVRGALRQTPGFQGVSCGCTGRYDRWEFKADPSCGGEVTSPPLTWQSADLVPTVCDMLVEAGAVVDRRCGLHVHHRVEVTEDKQLRRIWLLWAALEPAIQGFLPAWRRENQFARSLLNGRGPWAAARDLITPIRRFRPLVEGDSRYRSLNLTHWWRTSRVEIRSYHGTLDGWEILNWCLFTQLVLTASKETVRQSVIQHIAEGDIAGKYRNLLALVMGYSGNARVQDLRAMLRHWLQERNPAQVNHLEAA